MAKLTTLKPRLRVANTQRLRPLVTEDRRISGSSRVALKRRLYMRDDGCCCMCNRLVGLHDSELDHRIALQFGGNNDESNLWTLCNDCHSRKSAREASTRQPDIEAMKHDVPSGRKTGSAGGQSGASMSCQSPRRSRGERHH